MSIRNGARGIDDELGHIRDLIVVRDMLAARGATASELREYDSVIDCARERLADCVRDSQFSLNDAA